MTSSLVITYHAVGNRPLATDPIRKVAAESYTTSLENFVRALAEVRAEACCTASEFTDKTRGEWLVLTFDGGLLTDYEHVFPALACRGLRGTFFVTANNVGKRGYTSPAQLRQMVRAGMEIGSQGLTHRYLITMTRDEAIREIRESKEKLEQELDTAVSSFAPAGGHFSRWMPPVAAGSGYRTFATMIPGRTWKRHDFALLRRNHVRSCHDAAYASRLMRGDRGVLRAGRLRYSLLKLPKTLLGLPLYDRLKESLFLAAGHRSAGAANNKIQRSPTSCT